MEPSMRVVCDEHIRRALAEDMNAGDLSTRAVVPHARAARVQLICKQDGIIAGLDVFERVFQLLDAGTRCAFEVADGDEVHAGQLLGHVEGDARVLLSGERTALNYLQRMSGIATKARRMSRLLEGTHAVLADTRKTTPGMRVFEKRAAAIGGAANHRFNLSDCIMLKDNHIDAAGSIAAAVAAARKVAPFTARVEVETESLAQVQEALEAGADIIMLDNMDAAAMRQAVQLVAGRAIVECSGNVTEENAAELAATGVDVISSGAITHSAGILDLSLKHLEYLDADAAPAPGAAAGTRAAGAWA